MCPWPPFIKAMSLLAVTSSHLEVKRTASIDGDAEHCCWGRSRTASSVLKETGWNEAARMVAARKKAADVIGEWQGQAS